MLDIMKAIYDMMGKCTYPVLKEETPRQHVEIFFQAAASTVYPNHIIKTPHALLIFFLLFPPISLLQQKMDKNKDGVVTIDEFIDCCQNVSCTATQVTLFSTLAPATVGIISVCMQVSKSLFILYFFGPQDENIMRSMHLFENII